MASKKGITMKSYRVFPYKPPRLARSKRTPFTDRLVIGFSILLGIFFLLCLLFGTRAEAEPKPKPILPAFHVHKPADRSFLFASLAVSAAYATDIKSTHDFIQNCPRCVDIGSPVLGHNTRNLAEIAIGSAVLDGTLMFADWEFKKHVHNRTLNKLWMAVPGFLVAGHLNAAVHNEHLR
jgi:hypothetical protein